MAMSRSEAGTEPGGVQFVPRRERAGGARIRRWLICAASAVIAVIGAGAGAGISAASAAGPPGAPAGGSWAPAGQMDVARSEASVTGLADGSVLVAGGGNPPQASAQLFDPAAGTWSSTGPMGVARVAHAAVRLADGRVLVTGGRVSPDAIGTAEIYDPATKTWAPAAPMALTRQAHTATLLSDGRALVVGGLGGGHGPHRAEAEVFDPASGAWSPAGALPQARGYHSATRLPDGRVLVVGGEGAPHDASLRDAAIFDPRATTWAPVPSLLATGRSDHTATVLPDGTVLVVGGTKLHTGGRPQNILASAEVVDLRGTAFLPAPAMTQRRSRHAATALGDGRVLVTGGFGDRMGEATATAEIYDPRTRRWTAVADMPEANASHTAVLLAGPACGASCDKVLVVGEQSAHLYAPPPPAPAGTSGRPSTAGLAGGLGAALLLLSASGVVVARRRQSKSLRGPHQTMEYR